MRELSKFWRVTVVAIKLIVCYVRRMSVVIRHLCSLSFISTWFMLYCSLLYLHCKYEFWINVCCSVYNKSHNIFENALVEDPRRVLSHTGAHNYSVTFTVYRKPYYVSFFSKTQSLTNKNNFAVTQRRYLEAILLSRRWWTKRCGWAARRTCGRCYGQRWPQCWPRGDRARSTPRGSNRQPPSLPTSPTWKTMWKG